MTSSDLENLVRIGKLKREAPGEADVLAKGHQTRNLAEYEGTLDVDERLVEDLIEAAREVRMALRASERKDA